MVSVNCTPTMTGPPWTQTDEGVTVRYPLPGGEMLHKEDVRVQIGEKRLRISFKSEKPVMDAELFGKVTVESSEWSVDEAGAAVLVDLTKAVRGELWTSPTAGAAGEVVSNVDDLKDSYVESISGENHSLTINEYSLERQLLATSISPGVFLKKILRQHGMDVLKLAFFSKEVDPPTWVMVLIAAWCPNLIELELQQICNNENHFGYTLHCEIEVGYLANFRKLKNVKVQLTGSLDTFKAHESALLERGDLEISVFKAMPKVLPYLSRKGFLAEWKIDQLEVETPTAGDAAVYDQIRGLTGMILIGKKIPLAKISDAVCRFPTNLTKFSIFHFYNNQRKWEAQFLVDFSNLTELILLKDCTQYSFLRAFVHLKSLQIKISKKFDPRNFEFLPEEAPLQHVAILAESYTSASIGDAILDVFSGRKCPLVILEMVNFLSVSLDSLGLLLRHCSGSLASLTIALCTLKEAGLFDLILKHTCGCLRFLYLNDDSVTTEGVQRFLMKRQGAIAEGVPVCPLEIRRKFHDYTPFEGMETGVFRVKITKFVPDPKPQVYAPPKGKFLQVCY